MFSHPQVLQSNQKQVAHEVSNSQGYRRSLQSQHLRLDCNAVMTHQYFVQITQSIRKIEQLQKNVQTKLGNYLHKAQIVPAMILQHPGLHKIKPYHSLQQSY